MSDDMNAKSDKGWPKFRHKFLGKKPFTILAVVVGSVPHDKRINFRQSRPASNCAAHLKSRPPKQPDFTAAI